MKRVKRYLPIVAIAGALIFIGTTIFDSMYRSKADEGFMIAAEVARLQELFHRIHHDCTIIDFDAQKNPINFLNVKTFSGSEVGPMNLVHPEKWQGPYLKENPTMYHIAYQVVSTNNGYFITPGDGVTLPNKKVVGTDIVLDKKADISKMMLDPEAFFYNDKPLAARLDLGASSNIQFFLNEDDEEL
jgi:hypothetical protein